MAQYELNFHDYWRIIAKRKLIIALTSISVLGSAIVFTNLQTPVYQASATVKVEPQLVIEGVSTPDQSGWDSMTALNTEVKIIKSTLMATRTAVKLGLIEQNTTEEQKSAYISAIQSKVSADRIGDTNLITISAESSEAAETSKLANATAQVYIEKGIEDRNRRASDMRKFVESQLNDAEKKLKKSEDAMREYTERSGAKGIGGYLTQHLMELETRKSELQKKFTDQHPEVLKLKEQISATEGQMRELPAEELEYARLSREVKINEELYTLLAKRFKEAQITEADRVQSAFIVTPAVEPRAPVKPNRSANIAVGAFIGVFLGFVLALVIENLDTSIGTIEDMEKYLNLPVLGVIPHVDLDAKQKAWLAKSNAREQRLNLLRSKLIVFHPSKSPFSEAYNTLRTNMKFTALKEGKKILSFTSAGISEGKTITTANFAITAAQSGMKTLLVETDLRRPSLHMIFGLNREPGFSDAIMGTKKWYDVVRRTTDFLLSDLGAEKILSYPGIENLNLMTSGPMVSNPMDLLNSAEFGKLLKEFSANYDLVVLDCPPILMFADAMITGTHTDGTIIVYQVGRMARYALKRAKDQLLNVKVPVQGVILNNVRSAEISSDYGYGYNYSYKYYAKDNDIPK